MWLPATLALGRASYSKYSEQVCTHNILLKVYSFNYGFSTVSSLTYITHNISAIMCKPCCTFQVVSHLMHLGTVPYHWTSTASYLQKQGRSSWHATPWVIVLPSTWREFRCGRIRWSGTPWNPQCSLPPTEAAFRESALRAQMAVAIWRDCLKRDPLLCTQLIMVGTIPRAARCSSLQLYLKALLWLPLIC